MISPRPVSKFSPSPGGSVVIGNSLRGLGSINCDVDGNCVDTDTGDYVTGLTQAQINHVGGSVLVNPANNNQTTSSVFDFTPFLLVALFAVVLIMDRK